MVPAVAAPIRILDGGPWTVVAFDIDRVAVLTALPGTAELSVEGVLGAVAVAATDDALCAIEALLFVHFAGKFGRLDDELMFVERALV